MNDFDVSSGTNVAHVSPGKESDADLYEYEPVIIHYIIINTHQEWCDCTVLCLSYKVQSNLGYITWLDISAQNHYKCKCIIRDTLGCYIVLNSGTTTTTKKPL